MAFDFQQLLGMKGGRSRRRRGGRQNRSRRQRQRQRQSRGGMGYRSLQGGAGGGLRALGGPM